MFVARMTREILKHPEGFFVCDHALFLGQDDPAKNVNLSVGELFGQMSLGSITGVSQDLDLEGQVLLKSLAHLVAHFEPTVLAVSVWEEVNVGGMADQHQAVQLIVEMASARATSHGMDSSDWPNRIHDLMPIEDELLPMDLHNGCEPFVEARQNAVHLWWMFLLRLHR